MTRRIQYVSKDGPDLAQVYRIVGDCSEEALNLLKPEIPFYYKGQPRDDKDIQAEANGDPLARVTITPLDLTNPANVGRVFGQIGLLRIDFFHNYEDPMAENILVSRYDVVCQRLEQFKSRVRFSGTYPDLISPKENQTYLRLTLRSDYRIIQQYRRAQQKGM